MRTTLTLDPAVAAKARQCAAKLRQPMKAIINSALRIGLEQISHPPASRPYRTVPRPMGLNPGYSYDNISELLAVAEGEGHQ